MLGVVQRQGKKAEQKDSLCLKLLTSIRPETTDEGVQVNTVTLLVNVRGSDLCTPTRLNIVKFFVRITIKERVKEGFQDRR